MRRSPPALSELDVRDLRRRHDDLPAAPVEMRLKVSEARQQTRGVDGAAQAVAVGVVGKLHEELTGSLGDADAGGTSHAMRSLLGAGRRRQLLRVAEERGRRSASSS